MLCEKVEILGKDMLNRKKDPTVKTHGEVLLSNEETVRKCSVKNAQLTEGDLLYVGDVRCERLRKMMFLILLSFVIQFGHLLDHKSRK